MKLRYFMIFLVLLSASSFAQKVYPLKTIKDVQYRSDADLIAGKNSAPLTDTVRIRAIALHSALRFPDKPYDPKKPADNQPFIFPTSTSAFVLFVQDSSSEWGGMQIYSTPQLTNGVDLTDISTADSAQYIEFTGYASEYKTVTEFMLVQKPVAIPINKLSQAPKRPAAVELKISDFVTDKTVMNPLAEKYEDMYVILRDVIVADRNTADGSFTIRDSQGNLMYMYAQSGYNAITKYQFTGYKDYVLPAIGSRLHYIRGVITDRWTSSTSGPAGYYISPLYPDDISIGSMPPIISKVKRNSSLVAPNQAVDITANIVSKTGQYVTDAKVFYRVDGSKYDSLDMAKTTDTTVFKATIPGIAKDSSRVDFYVRAKDNFTQTSYSPEPDTGKGNYFYLVLNRPLKIKDVQYSPLSGMYSAFQGYRVTLSGVVTADTSDIPGNNGTYLEQQRVFMQDSNEPWSGIWLYGLEALKVKRGDNVTVSGMILEDHSMTKLDSLTAVTINSSNNNIPAPVELATSYVATKLNGTIDVEKYEDMLVKYKNVSVINENPDAPTYNDAEILVADNSGVGTRVKLGDGAHTYHNAWDNVVVTYPGWTQISKFNTFSSITGVLIYTGGNYKLVPRKNDDFQGYTSGIESLNNQPKVYSLQQNYPNPFNPATTIEYSIPQDGMVTLKIYNLMGQEVKTLVNQFQNGGTYKATFDASRMPSGIYFYQLNSGSFTSVKKMLLLK